MRNKNRKYSGLYHELKNVDFSEVIGKKVTLTKQCVDWYKRKADEIGMAYDEMQIITSKPVGVIEKASYDLIDFTFVVDFGNLTLRLGIEDIKEVK